MVKNAAKNNEGDDGKLKALEEALARIEKKFGKGAILRLGEAHSTMNIEVIPSGSLSRKDLVKELSFVLAKPVAK
jgi:RecA/RadA recombinase